MDATITVPDRQDRTASGAVRDDGGPSAPRTVTANPIDAAAAPPGPSDG